MPKPSKTKHFIAFILIILISSLGVFTLGIEETKAGPCNPFSGFEGGTCAMSIGLGVLNTIITFFGSALNLALNLLKQLLNWGEFIEADIVKTGWKITRDLANMFFVLILMAIAFATILRLETYGMKALLPKLIIAALLINFSLVISGVVIDFAQVITDFFISQAGGDDFHANMMNATQATRALATRGDVSLGTGMTAMGHIFIGALITVIFLLLICFVFAAYALLLVIRMVIIWFLLILSPIVWLFWILPATRSYFNKWWNTFIKWCFFAPASAFFLYLAIFSYKSLLTANIVTALKNEDYSKLLPALTQPDNLLNYALVMGILFGGLIAAQQMGIAGASGAIGMAKGMGKKVSGITRGQKWWKARKAVGEEEAKEKRKRLARLRETGGIRQWARERLRPTAKGRAEARARKNAAIVTEAQRMGKIMNQDDVRKIAGKRLTPTRAGRMQKLAAQSLLANTTSKEHAQMMSRSKIHAPGTRKRKKIDNLANRITQKKLKGAFTRYNW